MRSIDVLQQAGYIEVHHEEGQHNRYLVRQHSDADTSRVQLPVAESDPSHTATSTNPKPVAVGDTASCAERLHQSSSATAPVSQGDPNLLGTSQEPTMNPNAKRSPVKGALSKTPTFHQEVINAYHEICTELPEIKTWTDSRRRALDALIRERKAAGKPADTTNYWRDVFEQVASSDFLCGRSGTWRAGLAWLLKPENFAKTIEGNYIGRPKTNGYHPNGD